MDRNRHKVKRQRSNKRPKSPPRRNKQNLHHLHLPHGPEMAIFCRTPTSRWKRQEMPMENTWQAQGRRSWRCVPGAVSVCTLVSGGEPHQRAVLSDSSSESLLSVTECRRACSRGLRRSVDPSSMWMEGISKWTRSVDMLSPGDMPSSIGCSVD